jgi:hypothetical protein
MKKLLLVVSSTTMLCSCAAAGKLAANMLTQSTSDLDNSAIVAYYTTNLYPATTRTYEALYDPKLWGEGSNQVMFNVLKRSGVGMYKIDGTVKMNDVGMPNVMAGNYGLLLPPADKELKRVAIQTSTGKTASFTIAPTLPVTIRTINGKADGATVNLNEDMTIELDNPRGSENTMVAVKLIMDVLGVRSFVECLVARSANRIVVPKEAFANALVSASAGGFVSYTKGPNAVLVERFATNLDPVEGVGSIQRVSRAWSSKAVTVSGDAGNKTGLKVEGTYGDGADRFTYVASKPAAFTGIPFAKGKTWGLASFSIRGTIFSQSSKSASSTSGNVTSTTTTTTTLAFPQLPDSYWNNLLETMYGDFMKTLRSEYNIQMVPFERVTGARAYAGLETPSETNTSVKIAKSYKGTRNLIPTSASGILGSISSTFAHDRPIDRLLREAGVDGLISVTIDFQISTDAAGKIVLNPVMSYRFDGPVNGYFASTVYGYGSIQGQGAPFNKDAVEKDPTSLTRVLKKDMLMGAFKKMLHDMQAAEDREGYTRIWALQ